MIRNLRTLEKLKKHVTLVSGHDLSIEGRIIGSRITAFAIRKRLSCSRHIACPIVPYRVKKNCALPRGPPPPPPPETQVTTERANRRGENISRHGGDAAGAERTALPPEVAARVEVQARGYFDSVTPIRPAKTPRSDPSDGGAGCAVVAAGSDSLELRKLRDLEAKPQKLVLDGGVAILRTGKSTWRRSTMMGSTASTSGITRCEGYKRGPYT